MSRPLFSVVLALCVSLALPSAVRADRGGKGGGLFGGGNGGGGGHKDEGGRGGGGGIGSGALWGGLVGGISAVLNGGSFVEGAKAGAKAAGDPGFDHDTAQAANAGRVAAEQGRSQSSSSSNPFGSSTRPDNPQGAAPPDKGPSPDHGVDQNTVVSNHPDIQVQVRPPDTLSPQAAAALRAAAGAGSKGSDGNPPVPGEGEGNGDPGQGNGVTGGNKLKLGTPDAPPAPPSSVASLDAPKRYQVNVPPLPPGREYKGQATADAMAAQQKLGMDAVASTFGESVDANVLGAPSSAGHPEGARRLAGEVGGARIDGADRERALRATLSSGQSRFGLKDYKGALAEAEAAVAMAPGNPEGYLLYARTLNRMGLHAKAEEMALKAKSLASDAATKSRAEIEVSQAQLYQNRVTDALASANEAAKLAQEAGNRGLEANALFVMAAACQQKGDRACMVKSLERAAFLDSKYYAALDAARAGKNIFDPKDTESLGLLDAVGDDSVPLPDGRAVGGGVLAVIAGLAGFAGLAWRRARREAARRAIADAMGQKKDDGLLAGKYELGRAAEGHGGEAWEARDHSLGRAAVVVRLGSVEAAEKARKLASVHHPNVVDVFEVLDTPKGRFLVLEKLSGRTLRQVLAGRGKLPFEEARRLLRPACDALEAARGQGVVHGGFDLSSALLCDDGFVKVVDLTSERPGSEQRGDVQAVAGCLVELVTGRPQRADVPLSGASAELAALLRDAAAGRILSPAQFADRLERVGEGALAG